MNPSILVRGGPSGPTFAPSTPGYVLTIDTDGQKVVPAPGGTGTIVASAVVNNSVAPGASVADALSDMATAPSFPAEHDAGNSGAAISVSLATDLAQKLTLTANCTLTLTGLPAGRSAWAQFNIVQDGTGNRTLTIAGALTPGGAGLTLSAAPAAKDLVSIYWSGSVLKAVVGGLAFA